MSDEREPSLPVVRLMGKDGNEFTILGECRRAARAAGWSDDDWDSFHAEATSGNYNHLLATVIRHFDIK